MMVARALADAYTLTRSDRPRASWLPANVSRHSITRRDWLKRQRLPRRSCGGRIARWGTSDHGRCRAVHCESSTRTCTSGRTTRAYPWPRDLKAPPPNTTPCPSTLLGADANARRRKDRHRARDLLSLGLPLYGRVRASRIPTSSWACAASTPRVRSAVADLDHWTGQGFHGVRLSPAAGPAGDWINDAAADGRDLGPRRRARNTDVRAVPHLANSRRRAGHRAARRRARRVHRSHGRLPDRPARTS